MPIRVALIGYGLGGAVFHAPLIASAPGLKLAAVVTRDPVRREAVLARYPGVQLIDGPTGLWERADSFDLAVIAAPNRHHVPLAMDALRAGLPVVIDKPVAASTADARSVVSLAEERGLAVFPFHNRRWDGDFRTVRRLIAGGAVGGVRRFESRFERWRPEVRPGWKESADPADAGSILYDLGAHLIDQSVALFGAPERVYAELDIRRPGARVTDDAFVALTHTGDIRSQLWMSAVAAHHAPRFRVLGARGAYVVHGLDGQEAALREGRIPAGEGWGAADPGDYGFLGTPGEYERTPAEPGAYPDFYPGVARCLRGESGPPVSMDDAITGLEVIEAAIRSARTSEIVVLNGSP